MKHSNTVPRRLLALAALLLPLAALAEVPAGAPNAGADYSKKGADTCLSCHDSDVVAAVFQTRHGHPADARAPFGKGQLQCEACHGPGGNHTKRLKKGETRPPMIRYGRDSETPVPAQNAMCLGCHEKTIGATWHTGPHDTNDVSCAACHDLHVAKDPVLARSTQADVCFT
jgi:DmsE family decaheme c-type cytochrome